MQNTTTLPGFDIALNDFLEVVWAAFQKQNEQMKMSDYYVKPTVMQGSKNLRIVTTHGGNNATGSRSVYCFVEKSTGNILKASGWKSPAKGARGNIFNKETYKNADCYGGAWYK